jgi:hypothetical protein
MSSSSSNHHNNNSNTSRLAQDYLSQGGANHGSGMTGTTSSSWNDQYTDTDVESSLNYGDNDNDDIATLGEDSYSLDSRNSHSNHCNHHLNGPHHENAALALQASGHGAGGRHHHHTHHKNNDSAHHNPYGDDAEENDDDHDDDDPTDNLSHIFDGWGSQMHLSSVPSNVTEPLTVDDCVDDHDDDDDDGIAYDYHDHDDDTDGLTVLFQDIDHELDDCNTLVGSSTIGGSTFREDVSTLYGGAAGGGGTEHHHKAMMMDPHDHPPYTSNREDEPHTRPIPKSISGVSSHHNHHRSGSHASASAAAAKKAAMLQAQQNQRRAKAHLRKGSHGGDAPAIPNHMSNSTTGTRPRSASYRGKSSYRRPNTSQDATHPHKKKNAKHHPFPQKPPARPLKDSCDLVPPNHKEKTQKQSWRDKANKAALAKKARAEQKAELKQHRSQTQKEQKSNKKKGTTKGSKTPPPPLAVDLVHKFQENAPPDKKKKTTKRDGCCGTLWSIVQESPCWVKFVLLGSVLLMLGSFVFLGMLWRTKAIMVASGNDNQALAPPTTTSALKNKSQQQLIIAKSSSMTTTTLPSSSSLLRGDRGTKNTDPF